MSKQPIRWGFVATGGIAGLAADDLAHIPSDGVLHAVCSRSIERARDFAHAHGAPAAYDALDDLIADPEVDAIYVATPHAQHHMVVAKTLAAGKPTLVEKAFTCTYAAAADLVQQARASDVFLMEAMWVRFQPALQTMRALIADGGIGEVRSVHADLGFVNDRDLPRLVEPSAGGGVLLDCGVYLVAFAQWLLGTPTSVAAHGLIGPTGVDIEAGVLLGFADGAHAILSCSFTSDSPGSVTIVGTAGHIVIEPRFHHTPAVRVTRRGAGTVRFENHLIGSGLAHEFIHVAECIRTGVAESPIMSLDDTLAVMSVLDDALELVGAPHRDEGFTPRP